MTKKTEMEQLLRKPEVQKMAANMSNSTLYHLMNTGDFPKPVKLGKRSVAWRRSEIEEWINSRERAMGTSNEESKLTDSLQNTSTKQNYTKELS